VNIDPHNLLKSKSIVRGHTKHGRLTYFGQDPLQTLLELNHVLEHSRFSRWINGRGIILETSNKVGFAQMEMIPLPATFGHVPHCANCSERPRHREVWVSRSFKNVDYGLEMVWTAWTYPKMGHH
jgi:hypothetical protein